MLLTLSGRVKSLIYLVEQQMIWHWSSPQIGGLGDGVVDNEGRNSTEGTRDNEEGEIVSTEEEHGEAIVPKQVPEVYTSIENYVEREIKRLTHQINEHLPTS